MGATANTFPDPETRRKCRDITFDIAAEALALAMNAFVGRDRPWSFAALEAATGIAESTLRDYAGGKATPGGVNLLKLAAVLPSEWCDIVLSPAGLGGVRRLVRGEACSLTLNARAAELVALIGLHLADDGLIDHREEAAQEPLVRALRSRCDHWLSARAAQRRAA